MVKRDDAISRAGLRAGLKLGGDNTRTSYRQFVAGFSHTRRDVVTILTWTGGQATAKIAVFETDGSVRYFQGAYVVGNGVITSFNVDQVRPRLLAAEAAVGKSVR